MTDRKPKNIAASIRARLHNNSKKTMRPLQEVIHYYVMERFLFRLSNSVHASRFVLKGGLMLKVWEASSSRPTKDIDFLVTMNNDLAYVKKVVQEICEQVVENDGLQFLHSSIQATEIKKSGDYKGVRVTFQCKLQNVPVRMQIDMGFNDIVTPKAIDIEYPTILDHAKPLLSAYTKESVIAEKFEAMVQLGSLNSRSRDFFDIWTLSRQFNFNGKILSQAIQDTFSNRNTKIDVNPIAFRPEFASSKVPQAQWNGFRRKAKLEFAPRLLQDACHSISKFLLPVVKSIEANEEFHFFWIAPGPWQPEQPKEL